VASRSQILSYCSQHSLLPANKKTKLGERHAEALKVPERCANERCAGARWRATLRPSQRSCAPPPPAHFTCSGTRPLYLRRVATIERNTDAQGLPLQSWAPLEDHPRSYAASTLSTATSLNIRLASRAHAKFPAQSLRKADANLFCIAPILEDDPLIPCARCARGGCSFRKSTC
jgi:hypothetical protein